jgi:peptidoglycan/LPS O-acetylase OafA/YrhL
MERESGSGGRGWGEHAKGALRYGIAGSLLAVFWLLTGSLHAGRPDPMVAVLLPSCGFIGGVIWYATGRASIRGWWWYYLRAALIGLVTGLVFAAVYYASQPSTVTWKQVFVVLPLCAVAGVIVGRYMKGRT